MIKGYCTWLQYREWIARLFSFDEAKRVVPPAERARLRNKPRPHMWKHAALTGNADARGTAEMGLTLSSHRGAAAKDTQRNYVAKSGKGPCLVKEPIVKMWANQVGNVSAPRSRGNQSGPKSVTALLGGQDYRILAARDDGDVIAGKRGPETMPSREEKAEDEGTEFSAGASSSKDVYCPPVTQKEAQPPKTSKPPKSKSKKRAKPADPPLSQEAPATGMASSSIRQIRAATLRYQQDLLKNIGHPPNSQYKKDWN